MTGQPGQLGRSSEKAGGGQAQSGSAWGPGDSRTAGGALSRAVGPRGSEDAGQRGQTPVLGEERAGAVGGWPAPLVSRPQDPPGVRRPDLSSSPARCPGASFSLQASESISVTRSPAPRSLPAAPPLSGVLEPHACRALSCVRRTHTALRPERKPPPARRACGRPSLGASHRGHHPCSSRRDCDNGHLAGTLARHLQTHPPDPPGHRELLSRNSAHAVPARKLQRSPTSVRAKAQVL